MIIVHPSRRVFETPQRCCCPIAAIAAPLLCPSPSPPPPRNRQPPPPPRCIVFFLADRILLLLPSVGGFSLRILVTRCDQVSLHRSFLLRISVYRLIALVSRPCLRIMYPLFVSDSFVSARRVLLLLLLFLFLPLLLLHFLRFHFYHQMHLVSVSFSCSALLFLGF